MVWTHKDLLPRHPRLLPAGSHLGLIQVTCRSVDMAVSPTESRLNGVFYLVGFGELRSLVVYYYPSWRLTHPSPQPDGGNVVTRVELEGSTERHDESRIPYVL